MGLSSDSLSFQFINPANNHKILSDPVRGYKLKTNKCMKNCRPGIPIPKFLLFIMRVTFLLFVVGVFQIYAIDCNLPYLGKVTMGHRPV